MNWKMHISLWLFLLAIGFTAGYSNRRVEVQEIEKKVYIVKEGEVKWKEKVIIQEKIIRPDGTIEERLITKEEELNKKEKEITNLKEKLASKVITPTLSKYSLGLQIPLKFSEEKAISYSVHDVSPVFGIRVLGPVWAEGSFQPSTGTVTLGVRYEF